MRGDTPRGNVVDWFGRRTFGASDPDVDLLSARLREKDLTVSVCLPALNEQTTVGAICSVIATDLMEANVVEQLVVIDSGSEDATAEQARAAGAEVYLAADLLPEAGPGSGKGEALWKSLAVARGDVVVWVDSDIRNFGPHFVTRLLEPLVTVDAVVMAKGFYRRPLDTPGTSEPSGGGRVTELAVRPLLNFLYPELAGVVQPLSGEYAIRREAACRLPFFTGYAVDACLLVDLVESFGLDALAQVNLGTRVHRHQGTAALGRMAHEIVRALLIRLESHGRIKLPDDLPDQLLQFALVDEVALPAAVGAPLIQRPPLAALQEG